ncbi:DUF1580 domain-containing protein [Urbifossiella limnaea]|uniref:DUF1580 domain-containing protein n=1 Tax=Urbifossiella limnaea TaxID=2528023 RepID=A0A517XU68_9BACT|nr:DUF1580 domain-containing protein [Urbifossiella limnaea]QDU21037.1 hypothetical protein ETAA1_30000 [Urbifossiella limnaea]
MDQLKFVKLTDPLIPWRQIPRAVNPQAPPHISAVARWALTGVGSPRVKLETVKIGGRRYTTAAAIEAFILATSGCPLPAANTPPAVMVAVLQAEHELDAQGV